MTDEMKEKMAHYAGFGVNAARQAGGWLFNQNILLDVAMSYAKQAVAPSEDKTDEDRTKLLFKSAICTVLSSPLVRNVFAGTSVANDEETD